VLSRGGDSTWKKDLSIRSPGVASCEGAFFLGRVRYGAGFVEEKGGVAGIRAGLKERAASCPLPSEKEGRRQRTSRCGGRKKKVSGGQGPTRKGGPGSFVPARKRIFDARRKSDSEGKGRPARPTKGGEEAVSSSTIDGGNDRGEGRAFLIAEGGGGSALTARQIPRGRKRGRGGGGTRMSLFGKKKGERNLELASDSPRL